MNLPLSFTSRMHALLDAGEASAFLAALQEEPPVSIRLNDFPAFSAPLASVASGLERVPWCAAGRYLPERPSFTFDPLFHAGCYYVQEASSMFVAEAVRRYVGDRPVMGLDLCAAPGGKSTLLRSLLPEGSLLVANEVMRGRSQVLAENLTKWGHPDVVVTQNDPADFAPLEEFFDFILTDVPCSGEGMFRKDEGAVGEWSEANVELCRQRQRRILTDIWPCLKPGGILVYSTCTYNTQEDEENVGWICERLGGVALALDIPDEWHVAGNLLPGSSFPVYRFLPHRTRGEGFFLAVVRKEGGAVAGTPPPARDGGKRKEKGRGNGKTPAPAFTPAQRQLASAWVENADGYEWLTADVASRDEAPLLSLFPRAWLPQLAALRRSLRLLLAGVAVGELRGRDLSPAHALAMSRMLRREAFHREEVTREQAVGYLRKEAVVLPASAPRGYVLLTYRSVPLGFVKNVGNRANNLYPQEWRIRSAEPALHLSDADDADDAVFLFI